MFRKQRCAGRVETQLFAAVQSWAWEKQAQSARLGVATALVVVVGRAWDWLKRDTTVFTALAPAASSVSRQKASLIALKQRFAPESTA